ncbi:MAG: DUF1842 domain-containing protein [Chitinophagaceae bacterium]
MPTDNNPLSGAYLVNGTIGNAGMPGAPVVSFSLVVVPSQHKVSGTVYASQAVENGNYSGQVTGVIYSTGLGNVTQVVSLQGFVHPDNSPMPLEIPFNAHMAIDNSWNGTGGFNYANVHVENVPVAHSKS